MVILSKIAKRIKIWINYLLDRASDACNFLFIWSDIFPPIVSKIIKRLAMIFGDLTLLLEAFPRMDAYRLEGSQWNIVFVGFNFGCRAIQHLFFENQEVTIQKLERVAIWKLPQQSKAWLAEGAALVIWEFSPIYPWKRFTNYAFSCPDWVAQAIEIPTEPEKLLEGKRISSQRKRIRKLEKEGFGYRFTKGLQDHHHFYTEMYLPFIRARHGEMASICPLRDQLKRYFKPGGLVLVTQNDQPVAGALVLRAGKVSHNIEIGVLHGDPRLLEAGIIAFLDWSTIQWSHAQGAKQFSLGGSQAWCSNGSFASKTKWGARVIHWDNRPRWFFHSDHLPDLLIEKINQLGMIHEHKGNFYYTYLPTDPAENLEVKLQEASRLGLSGVALIKKMSATYVLAKEFIE